MIFALWDTESRNMLGAYDSEAAALQIVHEAANRTGAGSVGRLALVVEDEQRLSTTIAMGDDLINRARAIDAHSDALPLRRT
jgi:hypothetical protein